MQFKNQPKLKAVTFSYDDGVTQDIRLIELLNKYGLKCTFNLNSELLGQKGILILSRKIPASDTAALSPIPTAWIYKITSIVSIQMFTTLWNLTD